jgi:hypothetical protein
MDLLLTRLAVLLNSGSEDVSVWGKSFYLVLLVSGSHKPGATQE